MRGEAAKLKEEIQRVTGERVWVQAVVVIWGHFDEQPLDRDRVVFINGRALGDWLRRQPERLPARARQEIVAGLRSSPGSGAAG